MRFVVKTDRLEKHFNSSPYGKLLQTLLHLLEIEEDKIEEFINCEALELADPFLIFGMRQAVDVLEEALQAKKKVAIHGDFDVDGVSATAILWDYIYYYRGVDCLPIIPHRVDEGYGLSEKTIKKAIDFGAEVLITVDCGIKDLMLVEKYKDKLDFIITDHHQFYTNEKGDIELPPARAVVHSDHPESKYPTMISGGATSWQFVRAMEMNRDKEGYEQYVNKHLDLVAISTVCDIIPLTIENRKLIKRGLRTVAENNRLGLASLMELAGMNAKEASAYHFGFVLGPRLNAPGRVLNDATTSLRLLATKNMKQAQELAANLNELNVKRQKLTSDYMAEAEKMFDHSKKAIVVLGHDWPEGILGLIAGKLAEKYFKPVFIGSADEHGHIIGSSRSPLDSFYLNKALEHAKDHLERFGGHKQAAGFASNVTLWNGFEDKVIEYIEQNTSDSDFERVMTVDLALTDMDDITVRDIEELSLLEPHGVGNLRPVFMFRNASIRNFSKIGKEGTHLKMSLELGSKTVDCIGFSMVEKFPDIKINQNVDVVGCLAINEWNNQKKIQIELKDLILH